MDPLRPSTKNSISKMSLEQIKSIVLDLPANTTVSAPAHLGLPFLSSYLDTTLQKLSALAHHLSNPNSSYPRVQNFESDELKITLNSVIKGCEMLTKKATNNTSESEKVEADGADGDHLALWYVTDFEYFAFLPSEIRRMIWTEALSYREIIWFGKVDSYENLQGQTVTQWHDIPSTELRSLCLCWRVESPIDSQ